MNSVNRSMSLFSVSAQVAVILFIAALLSGFAIQVQAQTPGAVFNASPTSGNAQLSVVFTGAPRPACPGLIMEKQTRINFGDGEVAQVANCGNFTVGHLYRTAGTFTATLETAPFSNQAPVWTVLGTKTITANIPFTITPSSGTAPVVVTIAGAARPACPGLVMEQSTRINFGDGQTQLVANCGNFSVAHTYIAAGTYTVKLETAPAGVPAPVTWSTIGARTVSVAQPVKYCGTILSSSMFHEIGYAYEVAPFVQGGDTSVAPTQSVLRLFEGATEIGPAHTLHQTIRDVGQGKFSHWYNSIRFAATDNSNPMTNGRIYWYGVPTTMACPTY